MSGKKNAGMLAFLHEESMFNAYWCDAEGAVESQGRQLIASIHRGFLESDPNLQQMFIDVVTKGISGYIVKEFEGSNMEIIEVVNHGMEH